MGTIDASRWGQYNAAQATRGARQLARDAPDRAGARRGRTAVELGCGIGREAAFLADRGWQVFAVDVDPSVVDELARLGATRSIVHRRVDLASLTELPAGELLLACASLSFVPRDRFPGLWATCLQALRPGAVLAVDLDVVSGADESAENEGWKRRSRRSVTIRRATHRSPGRSPPHRTRRELSVNMKIHTVRNPH